MKIKKICKQCGSEFYQTFKSSKDYPFKFCSRECHYNSNRTEYICDNCGKKSKRRNSSFKKGKKHHYCSNECHIKYNKLHKGKNNSQWNRVKVKCANCKKILEKIPYQIKKYQHSFCDLKCYGNYFHTYPAKGVGAKEGEHRSEKTEFKKGIAYNPQTSFKKGDVYFKERYKDNRYLFNLFRGHLFPNIPKSQLTEIDKKAIKAKMLIHKIRRQLNVNK